MTFAEYIKKLRIDKSLTQEQVCVAIKMSQPYYAQLEKGGRTSISSIFVSRLELFYGLQPSYLANMLLSEEAKKAYLKN